ncbi:MAG: NADP-dependent oxidoreductase [Candidatus Aeolococcus gillhamiae]|uniref:NADP-dependent oxidoreductase n=1 Tax=Candidatus Aeolococcus gillhamiae TaxID=3127015 RepID=A0A2W5YZ39_9BACT|nr:MAG: NADP-dependent oxidoreductase [Candidatus Dormibacter sp. RRmetagenome_bin12]
MTRGREVHLASRPVGEPTVDNFALVDAEVRAPSDGDVLVRNSFVSVDPYMRARMNDVKSYLPPFQVGEAMNGGAVGEVVESRSPELAAGDTVLHQKGWREYATGKAGEFRRVDPQRAPPSAYLGVLGTTGFTAWIGLVDIAQMKEGDVVFVSGAAGAVGSVAGQVARLRGAARVIGSAGSDEKVRHVLDDLGFDAAFNYKAAPVRHQLRAAAPEGIDVYFDNVGGDHLEAAISEFNDHGRAALCGAISQYNNVEPPSGPRNLGLVVPRRLTLRGYIILDHMDRYGAFIKEVGTWLASGAVRTRETIVDGIEQAPDAFIGLLRGENTGKMLVRITPR